MIKVWVVGFLLYFFIVREPLYLAVFYYYSRRCRYVSCGYSPTGVGSFSSSLYFFPMLTLFVFALLTYWVDGSSNPSMPDFGTWNLISFGSWAFFCTGLIFFYFLLRVLSLCWVILRGPFTRGQIVYYLYWVYLRFFPVVLVCTRYILRGVGLSRIGWLEFLHWWLSKVLDGWASYSMTFGVDGRIHPATDPSIWVRCRLSSACDIILPIAICQPVLACGFFWTRTYLLLVNTAACGHFWHDVSHYVNTFRLGYSFGWISH